MSDHASYLKAFNDAVDQANKFNRIMQLRREIEYGKPVYVVRFAIQDPAQRFGVDMRGEFIEPGTPKMQEQEMKR